MNEEIIIRKIRKKIQKYFVTNNKKYAILGKSKGIDSSVAAAILSKITSVKPVGVIIPIESELEDEIIAKEVLSFYKIPVLKLDLSDQYKILANKLYYNNSLINQIKVLDNKIYKNIDKKKHFALANIKVRLRMITLYHIAQIANGIVIGTGNLSEYMTGFWTLHGDVGDFYPLIGLYKTEVYRLAKYLDVPSSSYNAVPTDGSGFTKKGTDEDQLGLSYDKLDKVISAYLENRDIKMKKIKSIRKRIKLFEYKRKSPIFITRKDLGLDKLTDKS